MILAVFPSGLPKIIKNDRFRASILAKNPHAVIINLRSTKALGLSFPTAPLVRADEVIE